MRIEPATPADWPQVAELIEACGLPLDGAQAHLADFFIGREGALPVAIAGLERYGDVALLRSVAVRATHRGRGLGRAIATFAIEAARDRGARAVVLLTTSAADLFERLGFVRIERSTVPPAVLASAQFTGACPASATVMARSLRD